MCKKIDGETEPGWDAYVEKIILQNDNKSENAVELNAAACANVEMNGDNQDARKTSKIDHPVKSAKNSGAVSATEVDDWAEGGPSSVGKDDNIALAGQISVK